MAETIQVLRALHLLFAVAWGGAAAYSLAVVLGSGRHPEAGDRFLAGFYASGRHGPFMGITALGTVLFGGAVMGLNSDAYSSDALGAGAMVLGLSMTAGLAALGLGLFGHMPTERRLRPLALQALRDDGGDEAEYRRLLARDRRLAHASAILLGVALVGMLTFRF